MTTSLRDLVPDDIALPDESLRDVAGKNAPLREECERTPVEERVGAMMPGDGDAEDHILEELDPSAGTIDLMMATAKAAHKMAEENPERGAEHGGPSLPDGGGETRPYEGGTLATEGERAPTPKDRVGRAGPRTAPKGPAARGFPIVKGD